MQLARSTVTWNKPMWNIFPLTKCVMSRLSSAPQPPACLRANNNLGSDAARELLHSEILLQKNLKVSSSFLLALPLRISKDGGVSRVLRLAAAPCGLRSTASPLQRWHHWADPGGGRPVLVGGSVKKLNTSVFTPGGEGRALFGLRFEPRFLWLVCRCVVLCHFPPCISFYFLPRGPGPALVPPPRDSFTRFWYGK